MKTVLSNEALAQELHPNGASIQPCTAETFKELGEVLEHIKSQEDYARQVDENLKRIEANNYKRVIKNINLWFFDALEREYIFRKNKGDCNATPEVLDNHFESIKSLFFRDKYE